MVEARKREEEELQREAERALAKRKKFKEVGFVIAMICLQFGVKFALYSLS